MSLRRRLSRLVQQFGCAREESVQLETVVLLPARDGEPLGTTVRPDGRGLTIVYDPRDGLPALPQPVTYKLFIGADVLELV